MSKYFIEEFLTRKGITPAKSFRDLFNKAPIYERLNIWAEDLIKVAHASGGIVIMAHPALNLRRTNNKSKLVESLLLGDIDGFEEVYNNADGESMRTISSAARKIKTKNEILYSGGSDNHFKDGDIGFVDGKPILSTQTKGMLKSIKKLKAAREQGRITHRVYKPINKEQVDEIISFYTKQYRKINENAVNRGLPTETSVSDDRVKIWNEYQESKKSKKKKPKHKGKHYHDYDNIME